MESSAWLNNEKTNTGKLLVIYSSLHRFKIVHWCIFRRLLWIYKLRVVALGSLASQLDDYEADIYCMCNYGMYSVTAFKCHLCHSSYLAENVLASLERSVLIELVPMNASKVFTKAVSSSECLIWGLRKVSL